MPTQEHQLLDRIRKLASSSRNSLLYKGIGDDCAVLSVPPGSQLLVTTDLCIEDVHFRRAWHPPSSVGHRCLTRGLSDIAAMGGTPFACFVSLALPVKLPTRWVDDFYKGLLTLARRHKVSLAGGDLSSAEKISADIIVLGHVPYGQALLRSTARPGDLIYVTGELGGSAAALSSLRRGRKLKPLRSHRHFFPVPRLAIGRWLRENKIATSMIDLSDGLSIDLLHICEESRVSARIRPSQLPISASATLDHALHGGEDYELLFTAPSRMKLNSRIAGARITLIGEITRRKNYKAAIQVLGDNGQLRPLAAMGWQHFRKQH